MTFKHILLAALCGLPLALAVRFGIYLLWGPLGPALALLLSCATYFSLLAFFVWIKP